jgi:hypothetical protein
LKHTRFPFGRPMARRRRQEGGVPTGHGRSKTCVIRQIWRLFFRPSAATVASGRKRDRNQPIVSKFTKERHGCCHTTTRGNSGRDHQVVGLRRDIVLGIESHSTKGTPSARPCNAWRSSCPQCGRSSYQRGRLAYYRACYARMPPTVWTAASAIVHCRSYAPHRTVFNIRNKKKGGHRTQTLEATVHAVL